MAGWFEYAILIGTCAALTIIIHNMQCEYTEKTLAIEMIVEVTSGASQTHKRKLIPCK